MKTNEIAVFGGGCFWCTEAIFARLQGVESVKPGYAGGTLKNPLYHEVSSGSTGHAEVIRIEYNPDKISYSDLLDIFWHTHNPTTLNRQGADVGTQYRSAIFYTNNAQKSIAETSKKTLQESGEFAAKIVTEIVPLTEFYEAENYHQNYFDNNKEQPYCQLVISPKLDKLKKYYSSKLK